MPDKLSCYSSKSILDNGLLSTVCSVSCNCCVGLLEGNVTSVFKLDVYDVTLQE